MYYRLYGAALTLQIFRMTPAAGRVAQPCLSLGAVTLCVANGMLLPVDRKWEKLVVDGTMGYWAGEEVDEEEWDDIFRNEQEEKFGMTRGMFFVSDIVDYGGQGHLWTIGVHRKHVLDTDDLATVYGERSMAAVRSKMGVGGVIAIAVSSGTRFRGRRGVTSRYDAMWTGESRNCLGLLLLIKFQQGREWAASCGIILKE